MTEGKKQINIPEGSRKFENFTSLQKQRVYCNDSMSNDWCGGILCHECIFSDRNVSEFEEWEGKKQEVSIQVKERKKPGPKKRIVVEGGIVN